MTSAQCGRQALHRALSAAVAATQQLENVDFSSEEDRTSSSSTNDDPETGAGLEAVKAKHTEYLQAHASMIEALRKCHAENGVVSYSAIIHDLYTFDGGQTIISVHLGAENRRRRRCRIGGAAGAPAGASPCKIPFCTSSRRLFPSHDLRVPYAGSV
jgi:hypothetical protein